MDIWNYNLRHLNAVCAVAKCGSILGASAQVNITQPALTQGLAKLEAQLGVSLFERTSEGMISTKAAEVLLPRIETAMGYIASTRVTMAQVRALTVFASAGSYPAASQLSGLSTPSLHRSLSHLSVALGLKLIDRRGKGVVLTAAGKRTVRQFRLACNELSAGLNEIEALKGFEIGRIVIGAMPLSRARLLPATVSAFYKKHPNIEIVIVEGSHSELIEPLRDGEVDILMGALRDPSPGEDVTQEPLFEDRPVILGRHGHPLIGACLYDLAKLPWVTSAKGTPLRILWERMFDEAGIEYPKVPIECGSVITIRQLLLETDFLTFLSPDQVAVELEAGWLTEVSKAPPAIARNIGLTVRSSWTPTRLQREFVSVLKDCV